MEENKKERKIIKVGILGDSAVGKTAILNSILNMEFKEEGIATIGTDKYEQNFKLKNNEKVKLIFFDNSGNERFRESSTKSMKSSDGIILIFDLTKKQSLENLNIWLELIKNNLNNPYIILFGNKADLDKNKWQINSEEINKFSQEKNFAYFETSAKYNQGINEGLQYIANEIYENKYGEKNDINEIQIKKNDDSKNSKKNSDCVRNKKSKK